MCRSRHPDVIFLSEAFTRPAVMAKLAEVGFTQSYTYFTWRTTKWELSEYLHGGERRRGGRLHASLVLAEHARHPLGSVAQRSGERVPRCGSCWPH